MANIAGDADQGLVPPTRPHAGPIKWTVAKKNEFLDYLAATCNISASAAQVGVSCWAVYQLRRRDKRFTAHWARAVQSGYEMLETQLIGHALGGGGPVMTNGAVEVTGPIDTVLAMTLLTNHRGRAAGHATGGIKPLKRVTAEETDAAILRKLAAMKRADARQRAGRKDRQEKRP